MPAHAKEWEGLHKCMVVLFSGPDGIGDHRTTVVEQRYVGHGCMSPESSSDTEYLYRSAPVRSRNPASVL